MSSFFGPNMEERRALEANRQLAAQLWEEKAETEKWLAYNAKLRKAARALIATMEETGEKNWDLQNEIKQVRREKAMLDAENNQLREENEKLQRDLGTAARCAACKKRKRQRAKKLVPQKRGPRQDGRPTRLCAARADYRQYR